MITIPQIASIVEEYFNLNPGDIQIKTRKREILQARQIAMYFSKILTKDCLSLIGFFLGKKDHATVLHSCKTVNNLIETDKQFKIDVDEIEKRLNNEIKKLSDPAITKEEIKEAIFAQLKKITDWKNEIRQSILEAILQRFSKLISEKNKYNTKMSMIFNIDEIMEKFKQLD